MWTRQVLSHVEDATAKTEAAILLADGEDADLFEDLMYALRRLHDARKRLDALRAEQSNGR